mmetsp:Transcript_31559/g.27955  ORF Transcript_31559/g.27955 Transcript_31559/m.27955 type:complete len:82 (+) Transcript_31559:1016-1261(+)
MAEKKVNPPYVPNTKFLVPDDIKGGIEDTPEYGMLTNYQFDDELFDDFSFPRKTQNYSQERSGRSEELKSEIQSEMCLRSH